MHDALLNTVERTNLWTIQWGIPLNVIKSMVMRMSVPAPTNFYVIAVAISRFRK